MGKIFSEATAESVTFETLIRMGYTADPINSEQPERHNGKGHTYLKCRASVHQGSHPRFTSGDYAIIAHY